MVKYQRLWGLHWLRWQAQCWFDKCRLRRQTRGCLWAWGCRCFGGPNWRISGRSGWWREGRPPKCLSRNAATQPADKEWVSIGLTLLLYKYKNTIYNFLSIYLKAAYGQIGWVVSRMTFYVFFFFFQLKYGSMRNSKHDFCVLYRPLKRDKKTRDRSFTFNSLDSFRTFKRKEAETFTLNWPRFSTEQSKETSLPTLEVKLLSCW
jgi:hypothetical protein